MNQTQPANSGTVNEKPSDGKTNYSDMSIKELFAKLEMQEAIRRYVSVPEIVTVKKVKSPFTNKETKDSLLF